MTLDRISANGSEQTLLILGASGDLTSRLLLPGLATLFASWAAPRLRLLGSGRTRWDDERWRAQIGHAFANGGVVGSAAAATIASARYLPADVTQKSDWDALLQECGSPLAILFALPPAVTAAACQALESVRLPEDTSLVLEKPFGTDAASAVALNNLLARLVPEDRVHRIDHFLGKSSVLNLLGLRFANRVFEPVLNADHVEKVDVVFDERLGLEGRAAYYDNAGALVDMIQSHLLQIVALLAMEAPPSLSAAELRDRKAQVLRATRIWDDDPARCSRRARYTAGEIDGRRLPAYADEQGVDATRQTETLAEVVVGVDTWRWAGVPFRLRSGKALGARRQEAVITFRPAQRVPTGLTGYEQPDRIRVGFSPAQLSLDINVNGPGDAFGIDRATLVADFGAGTLSAYGEILAGVFDQDPTLSIRGDTAVDCWRIVEPVLAAWRENRVPLEEYPAGSAGLPAL